MILKGLRISIQYLVKLTRFSLSNFSKSDTLCCLSALKIFCFPTNIIWFVFSCCNWSVKIIKPWSCKRSDTLFQKSLLLFSIWREYFYSQPTHFSSQPKKQGFEQSFAPFTRPCIKQINKSNI